MGFCIRNKVTGHVRDWRLTATQAFDSEVEELIESETLEDAKPEDQKLVEAKRAKNREIDAKTDALIAKGFEYDGHVFSLSQHAQRNWIDLMLNGLVVDPQPITTIDDGVYMLSGNDLVSIYTAGRHKVAESISSGQQLKLSVNACETVEAVQAVEDNR